MCNLRKLAPVVLFLFCASWEVLAQSPEQVVKVEVSLVSINVAVTNTKGKHIPGLSETDFLVTDRGTKVPLEFFDRQGPASIVFVVDTSSSMRGERWKRCMEAVRKVVLTAHRDYRYSLVTFADRARLLARDVSAEELYKVLSQLQPVGHTALYDGMMLGLETIARCPQRQKAIVLLSDGADNRSISGLEEVQLTASDVKASIYPVGILLRDSTGQVSQHERAGQNILMELADATGGLAAFPKEFMTHHVLKAILNDIGSQYTLSYYTPDDVTGWRDVRVAVASDQRLRLRYQSRYRRE